MAKLKYKSEILNERASTHGDYIPQATFAQAIKNIIRCSAGWKQLTPPMKESLEMMATKIARITHGDPTHKDSWDDIAGYAQLISKELED